MENNGNTDRRLGLLHTTGNAMLTTASKAYKKAELLPNPVGTIAQKLGRVVRPIVHTIKNHSLAILSYTDDRILYAANVVENVFPPSSYIFNKIGILVQVIETLPVKFDNAADKLPAVIQRVPHLEWALSQLLLILSFLINITFTDLGVDGAVEKEIRIDTNSHDEIATNNNRLTGNEGMCIQSSTGNEEEKENEKEIKEMDKDVDVMVEKRDVNEEEMNEKKDATTLPSFFSEVLEMDMKKNEDEIRQQQQEEEEQSDDKEIVSVTKNDEVKDTKVIKKEEQNPIEKFFSATGWFKK
ncbi:hypothetical protein C5167_030912 [Papaver somniferum]|uniref:uncharacterized protein LOC113334904 n=1 Tax=Papaver somniferum TaxID=3469 RepID=UPI000E6F4EC9|nr:uncharacterized protein LOC113334904 [Papaver somniferum]RZC89216.1 hypothetical protein C5167_030912 [Papaver somniferum]